MKNKFRENIKYEEEIYKGKGYSTDLALNKKELDFIKKKIYEQWIYRIQIINPKLASKIFKNKISIENYHLISNELNHSKVWPKNTRIFSNIFSNWLRESDFYKLLHNIFGDFIISDEDDLGWPNIYWRLVRPKTNSDIGPLHRDSWFWTLNDNFPKPNFNFSRIKVWIPIHTEIGLNGLMIEEYSQNRKDIVWEGELRDGILKPVIKTDINKLNPKLIKVEEGQAILFNDNLIHGGSINFAEKCRVSLEFTMLIRENS